MDTDQKKSTENDSKEPNILPATEVVQNPNPRANENIRVRTDEPVSEDHSSKVTGSEITDGEDA